MYLKTLTMKGFKSFASTTTLRFEPGITCVVGPNGSGKSNVVDALAWVMGEQGAKSLRGGSMEDVIFACTANRPPLGRAEVSVTIDNTDGALPIEYTEVTISRTRFRSGGSEYAINGRNVRLLDVQELLSDSGIGHEMHVIVGQGQLDTVLRATPVERRGFIEEAAGVLKHRKRKEKALRKLDAMQANLTRLSDLTTEIRRQLGPLGRQAEMARRAATIAATARDARARLLADDLVQLTAALEQETADESALLARRDEVEQALAAARRDLTEANAAAERSAPALAAAGQVWFALSRLRDRTAATTSLAAERIRLLGDSDEGEQSGPDPDRLAEQARAARAEEADLADAVDQLRQALAAAVTARGEAEERHREAERAVAALARAAADRREGLARLQGQVGAARSRVESAHAEINRLAGAITEAERRAAQAQQEFTLLEQQVAGVEEGEESLDSEHEAAEAAAVRAATAVAELVEEERAADRDRATWTARKDALELSLAGDNAAEALLAAGLPGVSGTVPQVLRVEAGYEDAVAAALGTLAEAVLVESVQAAVDAMRFVKDGPGGRARLLVAGADAPESSGPALPDGARPAADLVQVPDVLRGSVRRLLADVVVVDGLVQARELLAAHPHLVAVTRDGDLLAADHAGGGAAERSALHVRAALDEATANVQDAQARAERARFALQGAREEASRADEAVAATLERLHDSDARYAAVAERLGQLGSAVRAAVAEQDRLTRNREQAQADLAGHQERLAEVQARLAAAEQTDESGDVEPDTTERDALAAAAATARSAETDARLAVRTAEERLSSVAGRATGLERSAERERQARQRAAERARQRQRQVQVAQAVQRAGGRLLTRIDHTLARAAQDRDALEAERARLDETLTALRGQVDRLAGELSELTDTVHRDELARAQQRLRIEQVTERAVSELGLDPQVLVDEFGPHLGVPADDGDESHLVPYVRAEQEKRLRKAERGLNALGKVNPLALEEFAALEERHKFLTEQLEDLKKARGELLGLVGEIDDRVQQVFAEAYADTAAQFEGVFARLFPGGEGRLVLTDPDDMLTTGIEVEARPAGKKVKRLSLLSGGERSLTAVALLVAIFKARPSPFYVMDEVEAALDDVNLGRLIGIFEELRDTSQLIVITHQKRTMEGADALYGVTMRGDGVSTVISQRVERPDAG